MYRYRTDDSRSFEHPPPVLWTHLADLESWNRWWPPTTRFRIVQLVAGVRGSKLEAAAFGRKVFVEVVEAVPGRALALALRHRLAAARAEFALEPEDAATRVHLKLDVPVHPELIAAHFPAARDFAARARAFARRLFDALDRRAGRRDSPPPPR